ncbi:MAG: glycosyltransferase family 9 protein [Puniceicoccales bacterium]|jgi:lipopolysaccharide heptosyltransferase I|nr:glycosyltransferase family 9 protein [Puniceicoccales bacterium]
MRILVIKPSSLGDVIHGMVIISELKRQLPECVIDWVVSDKFAEIVIESQIAKNVFIYERHGNLLSIFHLISEIRRENYDYVFDMQGLARSGIMTAVAKSPHKVGRQDARELSSLAYTQKVNYPGPVHAIDILREFLNVVGVNKELSGIVPELQNIQSSTFQNFLDMEFNSNQIICLFPESQRPEKEWRFFPLIVPKLLQYTSNVVVLLLGNRKGNFFEISSPQFFDLRNTTSLADIVFLIKNANLVIANDSGPLHISAALGRPTFGLFTATDPQRFGPYPIHKTSHMILQLNNTPDEVDIVVEVAYEMLANVNK